MTIEIYRPELASEWDAAVAATRNGTFLHMRGYMDYHADRFTDMSLLARDDRGRIVALLPANRSGDTLESHGGLTYGGWLMTLRADTIAMMQIWDEMTQLLRREGVKVVIYTPVPSIYHKYPAEEDIYALWRGGGQIRSVQVSSTIDMSCPKGFDMAARRKVRKADKEGITAACSDDWSAYWAVLEKRLADSHGARPVHTVEEMMLLHSRFPENIRLFTATLDGEILAGSVMFYTDTVAHSQYLASSDVGYRLNAMPFLIDHIINNLPAGIRYFDFGTSNEDGGRYLNEGLIRQKCSFGARATAYTSYKIDL